MPDLIITPNRSFSATGIPEIDFVGASGSGISLQVLQNGSVAFMGTAGALFSINDALTGSLMAVTDMAGLPILEVFDTDMVVAGSYNTNALVVSGSGVALGTQYVSANARLSVSGNTVITGGTLNLSSSNGYGIMGFANNGGATSTVRTDFAYANGEIYLMPAGNTALVASPNRGVWIGGALTANPPNSGLRVLGEVRTDAFYTSGGTNIADIFYPRNNPSGYAPSTSLTNVVYTTGTQSITGQKTFVNPIRVGENLGVGTGYFGNGGWRNNPGGSATSLYLGNSPYFSATNTDDLGIIYSASSNSTVPNKPGLILYNNDTGYSGWAPLMVFAKAEAGSTNYKASLAAIGAYTVSGSSSAADWIDGNLVFYTARWANGGLIPTMTITSSGFVGIGTNPNPVTPLHVSGGFIRSDVGYLSGAINIADIFYPRNNPSGYLISGAVNNVVYITGAQTITGLKQWNSGIFWNNVGINKINPSGILEIYRKESGDRNIYADLLVLNHDGPAAAPFNGFGIGIIFKGQTYNGGTNRNWARIGSRINDSSTSYQGANLIFETTPNDNDSILVERMRIAPSGNIGIGLISPFFKLDVSGDINTSGVFRSGGIDITNFYYLRTNPSGYASLSVTGSSPISSGNIIGTGGISILRQGNNNIIVSGNNTSQSFLTGFAPGNEAYWIKFPVAFNTIPIVNAQTASTNSIYTQVLQEISKTGFKVLFSDIVTGTSEVTLNVTAFESGAVNGYTVVNYTGLNGGQNLGVGTGIYVDFLGSDIRFRSIQATGNNNLVVSNNTLYISGVASAPLNEYQRTVTGNYTIIDTDKRIYCNNTSTITLTLPSSLINSGMNCKIKLLNTGVVVLTGNSSTLIEDATSYVIGGQYSARELHAYGQTGSLLLWYVW